ncbi:MAG: hypothetical protein QNL07_05045 [Candidatus Planktophila sp.]|jgi:hypothetical protein|tara:strand:- start:8952 stop:9098 length:147 start_codon:yes stop_codon:yes gene_type:complete
MIMAAINFKSISLASEGLRELPAPPYAFGIGAFLIFALFLYLALRLDD